MSQGHRLVLELTQDPVSAMTYQSSPFMFFRNDAGEFISQRSQGLGEARGERWVFIEVKDIFRPIAYFQVGHPGVKYKEQMYRDIENGAVSVSRPNLTFENVWGWDTWASTLNPKAEPHALGHNNDLVMVSTDFGTSLDHMGWVYVWRDKETGIIMTGDESPPSNGHSFVVVHVRWGDSGTEWYGHPKRMFELTEAKSFQEEIPRWVEARVLFGPRVSVA